MGGLNSKHLFFTVLGAGESKIYLQLIAGSFPRLSLEGALPRVSSPLSGDSSAGWGQRLRGAPRPQSLPRDTQGQGRPRLDVAPGSTWTLQSDSDPELRTQKKSSLVYWTGKFNFKKQNPSECAEAHPRTFPQQPRTLEGTALACPQ